MPTPQTPARRSVLPALLVTAAMALPAAAQEAPPVEAREDVTTFALDNGMEVVVVEDRRAPVVVHMVWYRAGAADEPPGASGIAHYLEHLMFKGTDELGPGEFSEIVAAQGGTDNAFTSQDTTAYFQRVAADRLGLMMRHEADRMVDLDLTERDIVTERAVVIEERAQRTDSDPGALFGEQRTAAQYLNHPYGVPIIGWKHEAEALTLEDAVSFYEAHYGPDNAVLVVAGDVSAEEVRRLAEEHYGPVPAAGIPERVRPQEPPQRGERRVTYEDARVGQPYVVRTYLAPERDAGDQREAAALTLLAEVLGGSPTTAVLPRKLQIETDETLYASAFYEGTSLDDTTFGLVAVPGPGRTLEEAEASLDRAIAEFLEEGVDPEQLDRIRFELRAARIYAADDASSRARRYGRALTSGLTVEDVHAWPGLLQEVGEDEILDAARLLLDRDRAVTGYLTRPDDGPEEGVGEPAPQVEPASAEAPDAALEGEDS